MNLTKKQQVLFVATLFVFLMIIWQVYSIFSTPSEPAKLSQAMPTAPVIVGVKPAKMPNAEAAGVSRLEQDAYLRLASEYQLIQMQRMIAEGYAAIATARLNAAKALAELNKYNVDVGAGSLSGMSEGKGEYELIYLGQQGGEWSATLKKGAQQYDVTAGTVLGKGMRVLQIDDNGVVVMRNNKKLLITFNGDAPAGDEELEKEGIEPAGAESPAEAVAASEKTTIAEIKKPVPAVTEKTVTVSAPVASPVVAKQPAPVAPKATAIPTAPSAVVQPAPKPIVKLAPISTPVSQPVIKKQEVESMTKTETVVSAPIPQPVAKKVEAVPAPKPESVVPIAAAIKPVPSMPSIQIALVPKTSSSDAKKSDTTSAEPMATKPPAAVSPPPKPLSMPAAAVPAKPLMPAIPEAKKAELPVQTAAAIVPPVKKPTAAEQADFQQLQALLPPEQAKKINGSGQPAAPTVPPKPAVTPVKPTPVAESVKPEPATKTIEEKPTLALAAVASKQEKTVESTPAKPEPAASVAMSQAVGSSSGIPSSEAHLLAANPGSYTIQMIANTEPSSLFKFIKTQKLEDKAMWYRTVLKGGPWCVLVYGEYPDMASANRALAALPAQTRAWTPFVRKMASVQMAIKQGPAKDVMPETKSVEGQAQVTPAPKMPVMPTVAPVTEPVAQKVEKVEKPAAASVVEEKPAVVAKPEQALPESKPVAKKETVVATYPSAEKQLLAAKPTAYTIQLTASSDLDVVLKFLTDNQLDKRAMWYRTMRDGKDWYVLVYGEFADMTDAKKAFAELPESIRSTTPFVRQISSIQAAMKRK